MLQELVVSEPALCSEIRLNGWHRDDFASSKASQDQMAHKAAKHVLSSCAELGGTHMVAAYALVLGSTQMVELTTVMRICKPPNTDLCDMFRDRCSVPPC